MQADEGEEYPREHEREIFARLGRRIRGAMTHQRRGHVRDGYFVSHEEMFWDRRLGTLINDALALGFARKRGLDPFAKMLHEAFQVGAPLSLGYLQVAGHINDLALQDWRPWTKSAIAKFNALAELHARALVSLEEVLLLSFNGYPAGAATVSRTLHEVRVIACFLGRFDANLSERFLESHIVDLWRSRTDFAPQGAKNLL